MQKIYEFAKRLTFWLNVRTELRARRRLQKVSERLSREANAKVRAFIDAKIRVVQQQSESTCQAAAREIDKAVRERESAIATVDDLRGQLSSSSHRIVMLEREIAILKREIDLMTSIIVKETERHRCDAEIERLRVLSAQNNLVG